MCVDLPLPASECIGPLIGLHEMLTAARRSSSLEELVGPDDSCGISEELEQDELALLGVLAVIDRYK